MVDPIRTVVADDHDGLRHMLRLYLDLDDRFEVVGEAADGDQALALVADGGVDLLLLDIEMPNRNGFEVLEELGRTEGGPVVVVLTGVSRDIGWNRARLLGASSYVEKHRDPSSLVDHLAGVVAAA